MDYSNNTIKTYCNINNVKIPLYSEFEYYFDQLVKANLLECNYKQKLDELQEWLKNNNFDKETFGKIVNNTADIISDKRTKYIASKDIYDFQVENTILELFNPQKTLEKVIETDTPMFVSLDLKSANKTILEFFYENIYEETLLEVTTKEITNTIKDWKYLREIVFGKVNLKNFQKYLKLLMITIYLELSQFDSSLDFKLVKMQTDELIYKTKSISPEILINTFKSMFEKLSKNTVFLCSFEQNSSINCKLLRYFIENLDKYLKITVYTDELIQDNIFDEQVIIRTSYKENKTLTDIFACDGTKYYYYLKKYILKENITNLDLTFKFNKHTAMYVINNERK